MRISHFLVAEQIGSGGMGEVYAARDLDLGRDVAVKLLNPQMDGTRGAELKVMREARIASALNHANIVTIHEVIRTKDTVAIVMEHVPGQSLRQLCTQALRLRDAMDIGRQAASALHAAHTAGITHHDIKPENIMVRPDGTVKVLDFGLARWPGATTGQQNTSHATVPAGSWHYMSPEHYKCSTLTSATDVFALGLVLYEMVAGRHAFPTGSPVEVLAAIGTRQPDRPSSVNPAIPPALDALILSMLARNPEDRPTARAVVDALEELNAVDSGGSQAAAQASSGIRSRWAIAGIVAVALGLTGFAISRYTAAPRPWMFQQTTTLVPENRATAASISPDGRLLAYATSDGVFLRVLRGGETSMLHSPREFTVDGISWLPDGSKLIVSGFSEQTFRPSLWVIASTGDQPRLLRNEARSAVVSADGSRIVFLSGDLSSIWIMGTGGEEPRQVIQGAPEDTFPLVLWSADAKQILFQRRHFSGTLDNGFVMFDRYYERSFESADAATGRVLHAIPRFWVQSASLLSGGRVLLHNVPDPGTMLENQLWEVRLDASSGRFEGDPKQIPVQDFQDSGRITGVSVASGSTIALLREIGQAAVFVADYDPVALRIRNPLRLTLDVRSNYPHTWTADSESVIFESNRGGSWDIFRQRADVRVPAAVVAIPNRSEVLPQLTPDGKYILYASGPRVLGSKIPLTLMRVPVAGGPVEPVPTNGPLDEMRCSTMPQGRCVIRTTSGRTEFIYSELDPIKGIGRELARTAWLESILWDWDISPDGKLVALPNHDSRSARIRIVRLDQDPKDGGERERELVLPGLTNISGLTWSVDGKGWFVSVMTSLGKRALFCDLGGQVHTLVEDTGWIVPAPNGKRVAYVRTILDSNVWISEPGPGSR